MSVRRAAAQADWMQHIVCAVDASPLTAPPSGVPHAEAQMRLLQRMLCALHARTLCVNQVRACIAWCRKPLTRRYIAGG